MANQPKIKSEKDGLKFLSEAFTFEQRTLESKIKAAQSTITHDATMGNVIESQWISEFLQKYLPDRYAVGSGIIINSEGKTSDQIDIVIHDNQYTPNLLSQGSHQFVPAESVYAVIEVKPQINKQMLEYAGKKAASVRRLMRTSIPIRYAKGTYPAKELHCIIAGIVGVDLGWTGGFDQTFKKNLGSSLATPNQIDFGCALSHGSFDIFNYDQVFLNSPQIDPALFDQNLVIKSSNNSLVYFMFRLLSRLQAIGTVPAVDWSKYGDVF
jgi:hypothetical protein